MVNTKALKMRMIEKDVDYDFLAKACGRKKSSIRQKITGYRPLTLEEAEVFQQALDISNDDFGYYFFNHPRNGHEPEQS